MGFANRELEPIKDWTLGVLVLFRKSIIHYPLYVYLNFKTFSTFFQSFLKILSKYSLTIMQVAKYIFKKLIFTNFLSALIKVV